MAASSKPAGLLAPLGQPAFRWLSLSQLLSQLGDQLYLVALPWLALQVTGSAVALGTVLAAAALPRALLILLGGVLSDRWGPRPVMQLSSGISAAVTALLWLLLSSGTLDIWHLYAAAVLLGVVDALYFPATSTIVPRIVALNHLAPANAVHGLITQGVGFLGPGLAGLVVALDVRWAFALSAGASLLSMLALLPVRHGASHGKLRSQVEAQPPEAQVVASRGLLADITAGLRWTWRQPGYRGMLALLGGANLALIGPYLVGGSLLAAERWGGAGAFGVLLASFGAGGMLGTLLGGSLGSVRRVGLLMLAASASLGIGTIAVGFAGSLVVAALLAGAMGLVEGLEEVRIVTWFQESTPPELRGRVMGVVSFTAVGLEPVSHVLAGALGEWSPSGLFVAGGALTLAITGLVMLDRSIRELGGGGDSGTGKRNTRGATETRFNP